MHAREDVLILLNRIDWPVDHQRTWPPTRDELSWFSEQTGFEVPSVLVDWLKIVNGATIGPGFVYGIQDDRPACSMELCLRRHSVWRKRQWLPVADDGCGDYYMLVPDAGRHSVYFVDGIQGFDELVYACASNLWDFFWFLFAKELGESTWPFDNEEVLKHDPDIIHCKLAPMPWDAD